eukprot:4217323-Pyramimonas_sp.AAC.1
MGRRAVARIACMLTRAVCALVCRQQREGQDGSRPDLHNRCAHMLQLPALEVLGCLTLRCLRSVRPKGKSPPGRGNSPSREGKTLRDSHNQHP